MTLVQLCYSISWSLFYSNELILFPQSITGKIEGRKEGRDNDLRLKNLLAPLIIKSCYQ